MNNIFFDISVNKTWFKTFNGLMAKNLILKTTRICYNMHEQIAGTTEKN